MGPYCFNDEEIFLGIETSCDETALALIKGKEILGHEIYSQTHIGGVIPSIAAREHGEILPYLANTLEKNTGILLKNVQGIGVTVGPGLLGGLLAGSLWAQGLSSSLLMEDREPIPLWPVHHLGAHGLVARLYEDIPFPFVLLLLSGGHCLLLLVCGPQEFYRLGQSLDDAPGECLDKVARFMTGHYPGGPIIEQWAKKGLPTISLPNPLEGVKKCLFSFSGLKTAALQWLENYKNSINNKEDFLDHNGYFNLDKNPPLWDFCASLQKSIGKSLCRGLCQGLSLITEKNTSFSEYCSFKDNEKIPVVMAGGVASNEYFRSLMEETCNNNNGLLFCPPISLCTDNGIMIAWAAQEYKKANILPSPYVYCHPSWPIDTLGKKNKGII